LHWFLKSILNKIDMNELINVIVHLHIKSTLMQLFQLQFTDHLGCFIILYPQQWIIRGESVNLTGIKKMPRVILFARVIATDLHKGRAKGAFKHLPGYRDLKKKWMESQIFQSASKITVEVKVNRTILD